MPNFKKHFEDETLACKLMNWDTEFKIGLPDDHPLNIFKNKLDAQKKMFPEEAALLSDVIRLKSVIKSNMVEGFTILKRERESIKLKQHIHNLNLKIEDLQQELSRTSMLKIKLEKDLRKKNEDYLVDTHALREQNKKDI